MNKITYLNELETALDALPRHLRDQKMYEYERYFYEQELNGVDEGEILKKLKDPQDVAAETKARSVIDYAESKPTFENISRAVFRHSIYFCHPYTSIYSWIICISIIFNITFAAVLSNYFISISNIQRNCGLN